MAKEKPKYPRPGGWKLQGENFYSCKRAAGMNYMCRHCGKQTLGVRYGAEAHKAGCRMLDLLAGAQANKSPVENPSPAHSTCGVDHSAKWNNEGLGSDSARLSEAEPSRLSDEYSPKLVAMGVLSTPQVPSLEGLETTKSVLGIENMPAGSSRKPPSPGYPAVDIEAITERTNEVQHRIDHRTLPLISQTFAEQVMQHDRVDLLAYIEAQGEEVERLRAELSRIPAPITIDYAEAHFLGWDESGRNRVPIPFQILDLVLPEGQSIQIHRQKNGRLRMMGNMGQMLEVRPVSANVVTVGLSESTP